MSEERHIPVHLAECLRILNARLHDIIISPAERRDLEEAASLLELLHPALYELCQRIERCGASVELTQAVTLCSDLRQAIGNKWNPRDKWAEGRVRAALPASAQSEGVKR
jgi:hypothetical protein